jgi:hypothetical protein
MEAISVDYVRKDSFSNIFKQIFDHFCPTNKRSQRVFVPEFHISAKRRRSGSDRPSRQMVAKPPSFSRSMTSLPDIPRPKFQYQTRLNISTNKNRVHPKGEKQGELSGRH